MHKHVAITSSAVNPLGQPPRSRRWYPHKKLYHSLQHVTGLLRHLLMSGSGAEGQCAEALCLEGCCTSISCAGPLGPQAVMWALMTQWLPQLQHSRFWISLLEKVSTTHGPHLIRYRLEGGSLLHAPPSLWLQTRWWLGGRVERLWVKRLVAARRELCDMEYPQRFECGATAMQVVETAVALPNNLSDHERVTATRLAEDICRLYCSYIPDRSAVFELENMVQEMGLVELLREVIANYEQQQRGGESLDLPSIQAVIDVGGGNGYLALHAAQHICCRAIVVDRFTPAHSVDSVTLQNQWKDTECRRWSRKATWRHSIERVSTWVEDVNWETDIRTSPRHVALVAKHLCGTAIDAFLTRLDAQGRLPPVLVLSPCCYSKGRMEAYVNQGYLRHTLGVHHAVAWHALTTKTDWNGSEKMATSAAEESEPWRQLTSDAAHALLDEGRLQWLRMRGYESKLITFTPLAITPKNVAVVAVHRGGRYFLTS